MIAAPPAFSLEMPEGGWSGAAESRAPAGISQGIPLWRTGVVSGDAASRTAYFEGLGSAQALEGGSRFSVSGLDLGGFMLGGALDRRPQAALPDQFALGYRWAEGSLLWGDAALQPGLTPSGEQGRTLRAVQLQTNVGPGALTLAAGTPRTIVRRVTLAGTGSAGPYSIASAGVILPGRWTVRVDGETLEPGAYELNLVTGSLLFDQRPPPPGALIEIDYEEARPETLAPPGVAAAGFRWNAGRTTWHASLEGSSGEGAASPMAEITEGPYYASAGPLAIHLSRGDIRSVERVTADGIPLRAGIDFVVLAPARLVYVLRPLPPRSVVLVSYQTQDRGPLEPAQTALDLGGLGASAGNGHLRWEASALGSGGAAETGYTTSIQHGRLSFGFHARGVRAEQEILPALGPSPDTSGASAGFAYRPTGSLRLATSVWTARMLAPWSASGLGESSGASELQAVPSAGIQLQGSLTPHNLPTLQWRLDRGQAMGGAFSDQEISSQFQHRSLQWTLDLRQRSTRLTAFSTPGSLSLSSGSADPAGVMLNTLSLDSDLSAHAGSWLTLSGGVSGLEGSWNGSRGSSMLWRGSLTVTPAPNLLLTSGARLQIGGLPALAGLPVSGASLALRSLRSLGPWYAAGEDDPPVPGNSAGGNIDPAAEFPTLEAFGAGGAYTLPPAAAGREGRAVLPPIPFSGGGTGPFRALDLRASWQPAPLVALLLERQQQVGAADVLDPQSFESTGMEMHLRPRGAAGPELTLLTQMASSSLPAPWNDSGNSIQYGVSLRSGSHSPWRFEAGYTGGVGRGTVGASTLLLASLGDLPETGLREGHLLVSRRVSAWIDLFTNWSRQEDRQAAGFRSQAAAAGAVLRLPLGFGVQFQAQQTELHASLPALHYRARMFSISLVSGSLGPG